MPPRPPPGSASETKANGPSLQGNPRVHPCASMYPRNGNKSRIPNVHVIHGSPDQDYCRLGYFRGGFIFAEFAQNVIARR